MSKQSSRPDTRGEILTSNGYKVTAQMTASLLSGGAGGDIRAAISIYRYEDTVLRFVPLYSRVFDIDNIYEALELGCNIAQVYDDASQKSYGNPNTSVKDYVLSYLIEDVAQSVAKSVSDQTSASPTVTLSNPINLTDDETFRKELEDIVCKEGVIAIDSIAEMFEDDEADDSDLIKVVSILCDSDKIAALDGLVTVSIHSLLKLLIKSETLELRDAAALGIASLDDPHLIPIIECAIEAETNNELRIDMRDVLMQLIDTKQEQEHYAE